MTRSSTRSPNDPQDFAFTAGGGLSPTSFSLDDDADGTLSNTRTFADVRPRAATPSPRPCRAAGTSPRATCDDGSPVSNIDVAPGEHVTCTFTNRQRGAIVVVQDSQPNDPQDFSFTAGGGLSPGELPARRRLRRDAVEHAHVRKRAGHERLLHLPEPAVRLAARRAHRATTAARCRTSTSRPGETVTCTFENSKRGQIVVVKDATPNDPQDFSFTAGGGLSPSSFALDDDSDGTLVQHAHVRDVTPGSGYSVSESVPSGWEQTGATCDDGSDPSSIDVSAGEVVTCTFSNRKLGKIVVVKDAIPERPAGLHVHGRRRPVPVELRARRRLRRDAVEHAHLRRRRRPAAATRCPRACPAAGAR